MSYNRSSALIAIALLVLFAGFLFVHERRIYSQARSNIENHALVVADALWNYNTEGAKPYLVLACKSNHYREVLVRGGKGEIFQKVVGEEPGSLESFFVKLQLIPVVAMQAEIAHLGKKIGRIEALWYCDSIFFEIFVFFSLIMSYLILHLNARLVYEKKRLEVRVGERTAELSNANLSLHQEIEKHRQSEKEKTESEKRFQDLANLLPQPVWEADLAGNFIYVNQAVYDCFGYSAADVAGGLALSAVVAPEDRPRALANVDKILHGETFENHEYTCLTKAGKRFPTLIYSSAITRDGRSWGLRGVTLDISGRVRAEGRLRKREAKLESILQSAPTGIGIVCDRVFQEVNQQFCRMVGYSKEELLGHSSREVYSSDEEYLRVGREQLKLIRKNGVGGVETQLRHKSGKIIDIFVSWKPLDENDFSAGIVFNALDTTELKKLESQLSQARKMESIGKLAGGIAHDFNNILTAISGYAQMILARAGEDGKLRHPAEQIRKAGDRAANLTRQLLGFSRRQMIIPRPLSLNHRILDMKDMLERLIREDIMLVTELDERIGPIYADPGQLEQIVINLVVNARDALGEPFVGSKKVIKISTSQIFLDKEWAATQDERHLGWYQLLQVEDNGCGMTAEVQEHIFEPFYTTKSVGRGTGMGLAVIYGILKQNQGSIDIDSVAGRGTTCKIYWPVMPEAALIAETAVVDAASAAASGGNGGDETILLVEDDRQIREIAGRQLREFGYTVLEAEHGVAAMEVAGSYPGRIDLLFTDVVMPLMGGQELGEKIKTVCPHIRILYSSGYAEENLPPDFFLLNRNRFISKPYDVQDLTVKVRQLLNEKF
ncbi:MAG: PAS domain S-box protein [Deltaproteobacteria bacterium]|nr:PAS domain S-box protein [Deltaproteobacteria bacterium]